MTLWFILSLMTAAAILAVLWPLSRRPKTTADASDVAIYRDQLAEIDRDLAAGQIIEAEAAAAKTEVARRLIAATDASRAAIEAATPVEHSWRQRAVTIAILILLPMSAAAFYIGLGSPMLPGQPVNVASSSSPDQSIDRLVVQVEQHLASHPDDGRGWEVIAPVYLRMGRFEDAVKARRNALRLNGETADRAAALGEALTLAGNGVVSGEAKAAFERANALEKGHHLGGYYLGLAAEQEGDKARAAAIWRGLVENSPPDAAWRPFVQAAIDRAEGRSETKQPSTGPTQEQVAAAAEMPPEQRNAMVLGMVERLAERLRREGGDPEAWARLVRSYRVLQRPEDARAAELDARRAFAGEPEKLRRLDELLKGPQTRNESAARPTQEQVTAASEMPAEQRNDMVLGMVQRLSERLRREGGDPEGWARLVRSYLVLGKAQDAREAALDGRRAFAQEPEKLRQLNELLRDLGIEG
jgi:cytochrome c-type biogenesis protein CcmH